MIGDMTLNRVGTSTKKWYAVGAVGTLLLAAACGPISARDAQGVLDTGREIQRLQQEEIAPRLDAISELRQEIDPLEARLREIEKEFREVERGSIRPIEEEFKDSMSGGNHGLLRGLEEEVQARMRIIDEAQRELEDGRRELETTHRDESKDFQEKFRDFENEKSDRMRKIDDGLRHLYRGSEDELRDLYEDAEKIEKKMGRIDWDDPDEVEKAEELEDDLKQIYDQVQYLQDENHDRIRKLEDERFALEDGGWEQQEEMQAFFDEQNDRMRDQFDAIETRRLELEDERWALEDEMRKKFEEFQNQVREQEAEVEERLTAVIDDQLGPLEDEAMKLEERLEGLYAREHTIQRELAAFSQEIAPLRQNMESSMLDLLDAAIQAANNSPVIFANDAGE